MNDKTVAVDAAALAARDLREDLGARLLSQLHQSRNEDTARNARALLAELRALLDALDPRGCTLAEALDQWRSAATELADGAGLRLVVRVPEAPPALTLTPLQRTHPRRILGEFIDNALRHAHPDRLWLEVALADGELRLRCRHDGRTAQPGDWRAARGLRNQRLRAQDLGARLGWRAREPDMIELELRFAVGTGDQEA